MHLNTWSFVLKWWHCSDGAFLEEVDLLEVDLEAYNTALLPGLPLLLGPLSCEQAASHSGCHVFSTIMVGTLKL